MNLRNMMILLIFCGHALFLFAEPEIQFLDGDVQIRTSSGSLSDALIGSVLLTGDTVLTGPNGYVEIRDGQEMTIRIEENTVFTLAEKSVGREKKKTFRLSLGSAIYKFFQLFSEPDLETQVAVAGIRGTEVAVYAGENGESVFIVTEGAVEVTADGSSVLVAPDQGVTVQAGEVPGEIFTVLHGQISFDQWQEAGRSSLLEDPAGTLFPMITILENYAFQLEVEEEFYRVLRDKLDSEREYLEVLEKEEGKEKRTAYYREVVFPLEVQTSYRVLNLRYWALSALSLRQYVISRIYIVTRTSRMSGGSTSAEDPQWLDFMDVYHEFLGIYEKKIVPFLVHADFIPDVVE